MTQLGSMNTNAKPGKAYKGPAMEGFIATWYAGTTRKQDDFKTTAERLRGLLKPGSRILEVAPGPGYLAVELAKYGFKVTGLDISKSFVEIGRENARQANVAVDFRLGNASEMPLPGDSFDFVVCRAAFKNFTEPARAIQEMYRVLVPGGTGLIVDLRRDATNEAVDQEIQKLHLNAFNRWMTKLTFSSFLLKNAYTESEIRALVAQTDFRTCEIQMDALGMEIGLMK